MNESHFQQKHHYKLLNDKIDEFLKVYDKQETRIRRNDEKPLKIESGMCFELWKLVQECICLREYVTRLSKNVFSLRETKYFPKIFTDSRKQEGKLFLKKGARNSLPEKISSAKDFISEVSAHLMKEYNKEKFNKKKSNGNESSISKQIKHCLDYKEKAKELDKKQKEIRDKLEQALNEWKKELASENEELYGVSQTQGEIGGVRAKVSQPLVRALSFLRLKKLNDGGSHDLGLKRIQKEIIEIMRKKVKDHKVSEGTVELCKEFLVLLASNKFNLEQLITLLWYIVRLQDVFRCLNHHPIKVAIEYAEAIVKTYEENPLLKYRMFEAFSSKDIPKQGKTEAEIIEKNESIVAEKVKILFEKVSTEAIPKGKICEGVIREELKHFCVSDIEKVHFKNFVASKPKQQMLALKRSNQETKTAEREANPYEEPKYKYKYESRKSVNLAVSPPSSLSIIHPDTKARLSIPVEAKSYLYVSVEVANDTDLDNTLESLKDCGGYIYLNDKKEICRVTALNVPGNNTLTDQPEAQLKLYLTGPYLLDKREKFGTFMENGRMSEIQDETLAEYGFTKMGWARPGELGPRDNGAFLFKLDSEVESRYVYYKLVPIYVGMTYENYVYEDEWTVTRCKTDQVVNILESYIKYLNTLK